MGMSAPKKDLPQIYTAIARKWKLERENGLGKHLPRWEARSGPCCGLSLASVKNGADRIVCATRTASIQISKMRCSRCGKRMAGGGTKFAARGGRLARLSLQG